MRNQTHRIKHTGTVLAVGIAALDIVNSTDGFPTEDNEVRAVSQSVRRGGNATNTLCVLSQLGHPCQWAGCLADDNSSTLIEQDLARYNIDIHRCHRINHAHTPTSYITLNQKNGSRTIVHYRDLGEYHFDDFVRYPCDNIDWLHFEGRNVHETRRMLQHSKKQYPSLPISLEIEKPRSDIELLFPYADFLLFSSDYAQAVGYRTAQDFLCQTKINNNQTQICTWGDEGAYAHSSANSLFHTPALNLAHTVDSIGAGDTFNAGLIHAILTGKKLEEALYFATKLAGAKCSQEGFDNLADNPLMTY